MFLISIDALPYLGVAKLIKNIIDLTFVSLCDMMSLAHGTSSLGGRDGSSQTEV